MMIEVNIQPYGERLETSGYSLHAMGAHRRKCPSCSKHAIKDMSVGEWDGWTCSRQHGGCAAQFERNDERITAQARIPIWKLSKTIKGHAGYVYVTEDVLRGLSGLGQSPDHRTELLDEWFYQWDDGAVVDSLEKAELPQPITEPPLITYALDTEDPGVVITDDQRLASLTTVKTDEGTTNEQKKSGQKSPRRKEARQQRGGVDKAASGTRRAKRPQSAPVVAGDKKRSPAHGDESRGREAGQRGAAGRGRGTRRHADSKS